ISRWLNCCIRSHEECRKRELENDFPHRSNILLIDTKNMCLAEAFTDYGYIALSYVWGGASQFTTTTKNIQGLLKPESLVAVWEQIPLVIQEAFKLTVQVGEQFLWVDSLCIVQ
ncbi:hypothetical protein B0J14DRAFT_435316, partial [Halenospora varia]